MLIWILHSRSFSPIFAHNEHKIGFIFPPDENHDCESLHYILVIQKNSKFNDIKNNWSTESTVNRTLEFKNSHKFYIHVSQRILFCLKWDLARSFELCWIIRFFCKFSLHLVMPSSRYMIGIPLDFSEIPVPLWMEFNNSSLYFRN